MFQILEATTLLRLLDAAPEAVRHTIETGGWAGCLWPGHAEWEMHEACVQIRSLALHYFTVRHPAAAAQRRDTAAQLLGSQACPQGGETHLSAEPLVDQALLWLWALAGGPAAPNARRGWYVATPHRRPDTTAWWRCRGLYSSGPGATGGAALCGRHSGPAGGGSLLASLLRPPCPPRLTARGRPHAAGHHGWGGGGDHLRRLWGPGSGTVVHRAGMGRYAVRTVL